MRNSPTKRIYESIANNSTVQVLICVEPKFQYFRIAMPCEITTPAQMNYWKIVTISTFSQLFHFWYCCAIDIVLFLFWKDRNEANLSLLYLYNNFFQAETFWHSVMNSFLVDDAALSLEIQQLSWRFGTITIFRRTSLGHCSLQLLEQQQWDSAFVSFFLLFFLIFFVSSLLFCRFTVLSALH